MSKERAIDSRGTKERSTFPTWILPEKGGKPLGRDLEEAIPDEVEKSKLSPGKVEGTKKNSQGGYFEWLVYNFVVNESTLKEGHKQELNQIIGIIKFYSNLVEAYSPNIFIYGYASPSGTIKINTELARARAESVKEYLMSKTGLPNIRFKVVVENIYYSEGGRPDNELKRNRRRSVKILLPYSGASKEKDCFPLEMREKVRQKVLNLSRERNQKEFFIWMLEHYDYLKAKENKYCWRNFSWSNYSGIHGLFFIECREYLGKDAYSYLNDNYKEFLKATKRLTREFGLENSHLFLRAGGDPVAGFQILSRWHLLNQKTNIGIPFPLVGTSVNEALSKLTMWINDGKFGNPKEIWNKINDYLKKYKIPII